MSSIISNVPKNQKSSFNLFPTPSLRRWAKFMLSDEEMSEINSKIRKTNLAKLIPNNPIPGVLNIGGNDCWAVSLLQTLATIQNAPAELYKLQQLFIINNEPEKAVATEHLLYAIHLLKEERESRAQLSRINSYEMRLILSKIVGISTLTGEPIISLDPNIQADATEVYIQLLTLHSELFRTNQHHCEPRLAPGFETPVRLTKTFDILESLDSKIDSRGTILSAEQLFEISITDPTNNKAITIAHGNSYSNELLVGSHEIEIYPFKDLLLALKNKIDELNFSNLAIEEKERLIKKYESEVFQQIMGNFFLTKEPEDSYAYHILHADSRKIANVKPNLVITSFMNAPQELTIKIKKREINPEGRFVKICHEQIVTNEYGTCIIPVEIAIPLFEKFSLSEELATEASTYEVDSFLIHHGGESDEGGHYTSCQKINGVWYECNDSVVQRLSKNEFQKKLHSAYMLHYTKMPKLDEQAISITIPGDMEETNHIREALWQELSTPLPLVLQGSRKSQTSTDQIIFTQLQITQGEYYLLRDCRQIAASTQNKKAFIEYIKTLPQSLFSEIEQKASESASSSYEIKHLLVHDPIEKGFRLVNGNFHILKKVFDKSEKIQNRYGYSPHQLSCSTKKERDLFQKLISHIYETPMNLKAIETIFKTSEFKPVKDQLCQVSYFNFISEQLELLIENILFTERVEIIDKIIKSKELQIEYFKSHLEATRLMASPAREIDKKKIYKSKELTLSHLKDEDLTEFKLGLLIEAKKTISTLKTKEQISEYMRTLPEELRNLITNQMLQKAKSTSRIKKMLSQDLLQKNGRDILDKKLETLLKTFANNTELQLYYDRSFDTLHFENDKEREIYDELIQTFYEIPINMVKVHNIFYHKDFRNVRNQIRELVSLNIYSHEINRTCEELSSKELPEVLDLLISNFQQIISISTEQPEKTMASADCEFISTKKDATTRDTIIFCQISEQIKKCKTGTSITLLLNTIPEREIDLIRTELYKSIMESNRSINEMLKLDPIESGKKALNENLLAIQKIFTSEEILRKVFGNSSQITVPPNEQADYNSMLALILSDSKDKKQKIDKLFYHSSISTQTRNEIRKLVYLQQIGLIIEFEANRIMTDPRYLNQEGIKELLLATLKKLQEK